MLSGENPPERIPTPKSPASKAHHQLSALLQDQLRAGTSGFPDPEPELHHRRTREDVEMERRTYTPTPLAVSGDSGAKERSPPEDAAERVLQRRSAKFNSMVSKLRSMFSTLYEGGEEGQSSDDPTEHALATLLGGRPAPPPPAFGNPSVSSSPRRFLTASLLHPRPSNSTSKDKRKKELLPRINDLLQKTGYDSLQEEQGRHIFKASMAGGTSSSLSSSNVAPPPITTQVYYSEVKVGVPASFVCLPPCFSSEVANSTPLLA